MYTSLVAFATFAIVASLGAVDARPRVIYVTPSECSISAVTYAPPVAFTKTVYSTVTSTTTVLPERTRLSRLLRAFDKPTGAATTTEITWAMD